MFPYRDDNPTLKTPFVTMGLIGLTVAVWLLVQGAGTQPALARSVCQLGAIPGELFQLVAPGTAIPIGEGLACRIEDDPHWYTVITSMFLHGGWLHLLGNMWFMWVFGNNVEDSMGHARFVIFYLVTGILAALAQIMVNQSSPIPMVGASGAISGVMGAYLVLYPKVRVFMLAWFGFYVTTFAVPAYFMLLYWAGLQLLGGVGSIGRDGGGTAFLAHFGGFVAGAVLIKLFARRDLVEAHRQHRLGPHPQWHAGRWQ